MTSRVSEFHDAPSLRHLDDLSTDVFDSPRVQVSTFCSLSGVASTMVNELLCVYVGTCIYIYLHTYIHVRVSGTCYIRMCMNFATDCIFVFLCFF